MRFAILFSFLFFFQDVQSQSRIDSITVIQNKLKKQVERLNDSIDKLEKLKSVVYKLDLVDLNKGKKIVGKVKSDRPVRLGIDPSSYEMGVVSKGQYVTIIDYFLKDGFFKVCTDSFCGYINDMWIEQDSAVLKYIALKELELLEMDLKQKQELDKKYTLKFGKKVYTELLLGYIWIGMTSEMAIISRGKPQKINSTVGKWGVHEQWIYPNNVYLYFENDILTSYQY